MASEFGWRPCAKCETIHQALVDPHIVDQCIPSTELLAQVLVAKYADHLPLYRQDTIFGRAGLPMPRSTLAQYVGSRGFRRIGVKPSGNSRQSR